MGIYIQYIYNKNCGVSFWTCSREISGDRVALLYYWCSFHLAGGDRLELIGWRWQCVSTLYLTLKSHTFIRWTCYVLKITITTSKTHPNSASSPCSCHSEAFTRVSEVKKLTLAYLDGPYPSFHQSNVPHSSRIWNYLSLPHWPGHSGWVGLVSLIIGHWWHYCGVLDWMRGYYPLTWPPPTFGYYPPAPPRTSYVTPIPWFFFSFGREEWEVLRRYVVLVVVCPVKHTVLWRDWSTPLVNWGHWRPYNKGGVVLRDSVTFSVAGSWLAWYLTIQYHSPTLVFSPSSSISYLLVLILLIYWCLSLWPGAPLCLYPTLTATPYYTPRH